MSCFCSNLWNPKYGQYKMHGSVIIVPTNVDQIQLILSCLPHVAPSQNFHLLGLFLNKHLEELIF